MNQRRRWCAVVALLALGWLLSPTSVPLYDGVGFPDEPYRFVPARGTGPAATVAEVRLKVARGVNATGLLANSAEAGPQVSVFLPPGSLALPRSSDVADIVVRAAPVPVSGRRPPGEIESNIYALTMTSEAGRVSLRPEAQSPGITLRSVSTREPLPVLYFRASRDDRWRPLATRRVGQDNFNAPVPGVGEFALSRVAFAPKASSSPVGLLVVLGIAAVVMVAVLVAVRVASARAQSPS